jgi:hypothetical protein
MGGVTSESLWTVQPFFELRSASGRVFDPSLRATFKFAAPTQLDSQSSNERSNPGARVQWTAGALSVCPVRFALGGWIDMRPCLEGDAGFVKASGPKGGGPRSVTKLWGHTAAIARITGELPGTTHENRIGALFFELELGLVVPLSRYQVRFGGETLYTVPASAFEIGAGLGLRF